MRRLSQAPLRQRRQQAADRRRRPAGRRVRIAPHGPRRDRAATSICRRPSDGRVAMPVRHASRALLAVGVEQIGQRERQVVLVRWRARARSPPDLGLACAPRRAARRARAACASRRSPMTRSVSSVTTQSMPPIRAGVVRQRAVGERVVGFFRVAAAFQEQQQAFVPGGLRRCAARSRCAGSMSARSPPRPSRPAGRAPRDAWRRASSRP